MGTCVSLTALKEGTQEVKRFLCIQVPIMIELIHFPADLNQHINLSRLREESKLSVVSLDNCAILFYPCWATTCLIGSFVIVVNSLWSEDTPDAELDLFKLDIVVFKHSPIVHHLTELEHVSARNVLLSQSNFTSLRNYIMQSSLLDSQSIVVQICFH